jgi:23S rRNA maturation mini-RNase III
VHIELVNVFCTQTNRKADKQQIIIDKQVNKKQRHKQIDKKTDKETENDQAVVKKDRNAAQGKSWFFGSENKSWR